MDYYFPPIVDFVPRKRMSPAKQARLLKRLLEKSSKCFWCDITVIKNEPGASLKANNTATLDHKVARADGGTDTYGNAVLACWKCNWDRGCKTHFQITNDRQKAAAPNRLFGVKITNGEAI